MALGLGFEVWVLRLGFEVWVLGLGFEVWVLGLGFFAVRVERGRPTH